MKFIHQTEPSYGREEIKAVSDYLNSGGWLMEFKKTREFEEMIARFCGARYCSVVSNGTVSLFVALRALGVGSGDEVIVPDITMAATPNAVILAGAKPVFVDIEEKSLCLDVEKVTEAINKKTKAVMHVSLNGRAGELAKLKKLCSKKHVYLIEDAAQSLGSFYRGRHLGTFGVIGSFSFSAPKIITTGQGGALVTNDVKIFEKIKRIKDFGRLQGGADFYEEVGWNFKFTDLQAVFGVAQMKKIKARMTKKKKIFALYRKLLAGVKQIKFIGTDLKQTTPWFADIFVPDRKKLIAFLKDEQIGSRPIYPALHSQPAYKKPGRYPIAEKIAKTGLWLPSSVSLTENQVKLICNKIKNFYL
ncbi:MAG: DegT/DnrJ/EryC1/StrS family aminotransferase [bacterium]